MWWIALSCTVPLVHFWDTSALPTDVSAMKTFLLEERAEPTQEALARARIYLPLLEAVFQQEGLPPKLVWLTLIESGFKPCVTSPSAAKGMFQFKAETARLMGLVVDPPLREERCMPLMAAKASGRYLRYLHDKFQNWDLALAAYNLGEGELSRIMVRSGTRSWETLRHHLREETKWYVEKTLAAAEIGSAYLESHPPLPYCAYQVQRGDTLYRLAKERGFSMEGLKQLNGLSGDDLWPGQWLVVPGKP
jgi:membrane-bound lytic murein transglycosylase D